MKKYLIFIFLLFLSLSYISGDFILESFDSQYIHGQFANSLKGDMIVLYSESEGQNRLFYGIKKNGKGFFDGNYIKKMTTSNKRYESKNIFISFNNSNDNVQYLFGFSGYVGVTEIFDLEDLVNYAEQTQDVLGIEVYSRVNSLLELNNEAKEYVLIYIADQNYYLHKVAFYDVNLDNITINKVNTYPISSNKTDNRMVNGIILNEECILIFFISEDKFYLNFFNFDLILKDNYALDTIEKYGFDGIFAKCFNLKEYYLMFLYFTKANDTLKMKLGKVTKNDEKYDYIPILNISTDHIFKSTPILNEAIKLNSHRIAYFGLEYYYSPPVNGFGEISDNVTILLIDIYNNFQDVKIREYNLDFENYKIHKEISLGIYNNYLCFSSTVYEGQLNSNTLLSIFMIFGYFNDTNLDNNFTINIYDYFTNEGNNNNIFNLIINSEVESISIQNNIFGYELSRESIRLVTIPEEIEFYNQNNATKLSNGDILNKNYALKEREIKVTIQGNYFFEYQLIVQEPDYDTFNSKFLTITDYHSSDNSIEQSSFYEPQKFYGNIFSINFVLCPKYYFFNSTSNECQSSDLCYYEKLLDNDCEFETTNNSILYEEIKQNIIQSYPADGESVVVEADDNYIFQMTTTENELSSLNGEGNKTSYLSIIDLGECGKLLKDYYDIPEDQSLILLKYEKITEIASKRNIQYELYHPITKQLLNLTICENSAINVYVPVNYPEETKELYKELQNQGYDLFDPNDSFYQDICTPFKSKDGTDVLLSDRKNDFYKNHNNNTQCQGNCKYVEYLLNINYLKCECNVDTDNSIETQSEEKFDKFDNKVIYESFYDILKNSNYKVIKCHNLIFNKDIFLKNYGSILTLVYLLGSSIFFVVFLVQGINRLKINIVKLMAEKQINKGRNSVLFSSLKFNDFIENNNNKIKNDNNNNDSSIKRIKKESLAPPKKSTKTLDLLNNDNNNNKNKRHSALSHKKRKSKHKNKRVVLMDNNINIINNNINENKNFIDDKYIPNEIHHSKKDINILYPNQNQNLKKNSTIEILPVQTIKEEKN